MKNMMRSAVFAVAVALGIMPAAVGDTTWKSSVATGLYSEGSSWDSSAVPVNGEIGTFNFLNATEDTPVYTVQFPASGFTDTSVTYMSGLKDGQKLVFDVTGKEWYKGPGSLSTSKYPLIMQSDGSHDFLRLHNQTKANVAPSFLMTNGVLSCLWSATAGALVELKGGFFNWLDPYGTETPTLKLCVGSNETNVTVRVSDGAELRGRDVQVYDGAFELLGGNHVFKAANFAANAIVLGGKANCDPKMVVSNATVNLIQGRVVVGSTADAKATLELAGSARMPDASRIYVAWHNNVKAVVRLSDTSSASVTNRLCVGSDYDGTVNGDGLVEVTDDATLRVYDARVGYVKAASGAVYARGEISLSGNAVMTYTGPGSTAGYGLYVGDLGAATGVVTVAGHAQLVADKEVANRPYMTLGRSTTGCGILNATDDAQLDLYNLYLGVGGNYAVNLSGRANLKTPFYAGSWNADGAGVSTFGGQSTAEIATIELGKNGQDKLVVRDSATCDVTANFKLCTGANGQVEALVRDTAALKVQNSVNVGASAGTKSARFLLQDEATVTHRGNLTIQGADSKLELAGGAWTSTQTSTGYSAVIAPSAGGSGALVVSGGDHVLKYGAGITVLSANTATAATEGRVELLGGRVAFAKMLGGVGSKAGGGKGTAVLRAAGGTVVPVVANNTLVEKFDEAKLGAGGLTFEVPSAVPAKVAQAFTDETAGEGMVVKTGEGTLTATANSAHGITRIEAGEVVLGSGVTQFGKKLVLAGGTYTVGSAFPFEALQLGDSNTVGTLVMAAPTTLPITDASKFVVSNGVIRFTASPAVGDYTFIQLTGAVDPLAFERLTIVDPDGNNRYGFTFNAESGTTTVTMKVVDVSSITDVTWSGAESGVWATGANWVGGAKATAINNAVFPEAATTKQVLVDTKEAADVLKVTGGAYTIAGSGQVTTYGMLVTNGATAAVTVPVVPKGAFTLDVAESSALDFVAPFANVSAASLNKKGTGQLALTGSRELSALDWNLLGGRTTVTNDAAIGGAAASVRLGACTLQFPEGGEYAHDVKLDAGATDQVAVMDTPKDTVVSGALESVSGAFVKRGVGALEVDYPAGTYRASVGQGAFDRNVTPTAYKWDEPLVFPANGEGPVISTDGGANNVGLGGFNVAEGLVRLSGEGARLVQTNWTLVGVNYPNQAAEAELEITGGLTFDNSAATANADFRRFVIGQRTNKDSPFRHPTLRVLDGATLKAQGIFLCSYYDVVTYPTLAVTNATVTVDSQFYINVGDGNNPNCHPIIRVGSGGKIEMTSYSAADWRYTLQVGMFTDCDVDDGQIVIPAANREGLLIGHCGCGVMRFRNGGKLTTPMIYANHKKNTDSKMTDMVLAFDDGVLALNNTRESIVSSPNNRYVQIEDGGMTVEVGDALVSTMRLPFRGTGALTKTGAGTLVLGIGKENVFTAQEVIQETKLSGLTTAAYTGKTTVNAGTLVFEEGELVATKDVEVAAGATLDLSDAATAYGFTTLSGAGTVKDGTIGNCSVQRDSTAADYLTFDNVTLGNVAIDFGHDASDPIDLNSLAGCTVAKFVDGSTAAKLTVTGTGHGRVRSDFQIAPDGSVVLVKAYKKGLLITIR